MVDAEELFVSVKWTNYNPNLALQRLFINGEETDVSIACEGHTIKAHKVLLSVVSPFFSSILKEIEPPFFPIIIITDIQFQEINAIIQFLYNGEVIVPSSRVKSLFSAATKLLITGLKTIDGGRGHGSRRRFTQKPNNCSAEAGPARYSEVGDKEDQLIGARATVKQTLQSKSLHCRKATLATVSSVKRTSNGSVTATLTTHSVPIVDTVLVDCPPPVFCNECGISCANESVLRGHRKLHEEVVKRPKSKPAKSSKLHCCRYCPFASEYLTNVSHHERTHTGEKPHKCDVCGIRFARRGTLNQHQRKHTGERPFLCDLCGKCFKFKHNLKLHLKTHSVCEKLHRCEICGKSFGNKAALKKHHGTHNMQTFRRYLGTTNRTPSDAISVAKQLESVPVHLNLTDSCQESGLMDFPVPIELNLADTTMSFNMVDDS